MKNRFVYSTFIVLLIAAGLLMIGLHLYTGFPFLFILGFVLAIYLPPKYALILNASIGLFCDIFLGSPYGFHMLFYILSSFILILYRRKFSAQTLRYIYFFIIPLLLIYQKLFSATFSWSTFIIILGSIYILQRIYRKHTKPYHAKLRF